MLRATLFLVLGAAVLAFAMPVSAVAPEKFEICHATASDSNPYVVNKPATAADTYGHMGDSHQNGEDIIPPFTYEGQVYSQNWDAEGQAIFENDCNVPDGSETQTTTGSDTETTTNEVPFFGGASPPLVGLGAAGALGGALFMLRRRL